MFTSNYYWTELKTWNIDIMQEIEECNQQTMGNCQ